MTVETRLYRVLEKARFQVLRIFQRKEKNFTLALFSVFSGFVVGNIFGTFLTVIRQLVPWDGLIIVALILTIEIISYFRYTSSTKGGRNKLARLLPPSSPPSRSTPGGKKIEVEEEEKVSARIWRNLNYFKIGIMLGFFVDAFKVGS